jgi:hypothetical protein
VAILSQIMPRLKYSGSEAEATEGAGLAGNGRHFQISLSPRRAMSEGVEAEARAKIFYKRRESLLTTSDAEIISIPATIKKYLGLCSWEIIVPAEGVRFQRCFDEQPSVIVSPCCIHTPDM